MAYLFSCSLNQTWMQTENYENNLDRINEDFKNEETDAITEEFNATDHNHSSRDKPGSLVPTQLSEIDETKITDDVSKIQRIVCKICKSLLEEYSMYNHMKSHNLTADTYGDFEYDNNYFYRLVNF